MSAHEKTTAATTSSAADLALEGELTIYSAAAQRDVLLAWSLDGNGTVDLSAITDCDSAGVQLLLSARATMVKDGRSLVLRDPSQPVRDALLGFGLTTALQNATQQQGEAA
jgi:anti-sigma B factor antagonist